MFRYPTTVIVVLVVVLFAGLAHAQSYDVAQSLNAVRTDRDAGLLTRDQAALYTAYALFDNVKLPRAYYRQSTDVQALAGRGPTTFCGTSALTYLREELPELSPETRAAIERYLLRGDAAPRRSGPSDAKQDYPDGINLPNSYKTTHFAIRWGNSYSPDMDMIHNWGDVMENEIWQTEIVNWGYQPVAYTDQYYLNIYIGSSGNGAPTIDFDGAYTTVYETDPQMPYIVVSESILGSLDAIREVCSHEFYHTIQFTHAIIDGCYYYMGESETWFVEGSATWAESEVYPSDFNYFYYVIDWADNPYHPLTDNSYTTLAPYARVVWPLYLDQHIGGLGALYDIWNGCYNNGLLYGCNAYIEDQGQTWAPTYLDFMARIVTKDFNGGDYMPDFSILKRVQTYPFVQKQVSSGFVPYVNGMSLYELMPGSGGDPKLNLRFVGTELNDSRMMWAVGVLKMQSGGSSALEIVSVNHNQGTISIDGFGTTYNKMYLLISPVTGRLTDSSSRHNYEIEITRGDTPFPDDDSSDDDTASDDDSGADDDSGLDDDAASDDDSSNSADCEKFCHRLDECNLLDDLGATADNCMAKCQTANAAAVACVDAATDCAETAQCVGVSSHHNSSSSSSSGGGGGCGA